MKSVFLIATLFLIGCGGSIGNNNYQVVTGPKGADGSSCSVETLTNGALISCTDGTNSLILNGEAGKSCTTKQVSYGSVLTCQDGTTSIVYNGSNGATGANGTACSVTQVSNGAFIDCGNSQAVVLNGTNGKDGINSIQKLIEPCGKTSSPWKEELLCLGDGTLLASFSDNMAGYATRLALIPQGNYIDTDSSGCGFSVTVNPKGDSTVSWNAGSNQYATWQANSITCINRE